MQVRRHPSANCPRCGARLWYGLKTEGRGWKVLSHCERETCGREELAAYIPMDGVTDRDEAYDRAEETVQRR